MTAADDRRAGAERIVAAFLGVPVDSPAVQQAIHEMRATVATLPTGASALALAGLVPPAAVRAAQRAEERRALDALEWPGLTPDQAERAREMMARFGVGHAAAPIAAKNMYPDEFAPPAPPVAPPAPVPPAVPAAPRGPKRRGSRGGRKGERAKKAKARR